MYGVGTPCAVDAYGVRKAALRMPGPDMYQMREPPAAARA